MDVKNSTALEKIIAYAKTLGNDKHGSVTLDKYIVAVIDAVTGNADLNLDAEYEDALRELLREMFPMADRDYSDIRLLFMERILEEKSGMNMDGLSFQQGIISARSKAGSENIKELTPHFLLKYFFKKPTGLLHTIISGGSSAVNTSSVPTPTTARVPEISFSKRKPETEQPEPETTPEPELEKRKKNVAAVKDPKAFLSDLTEDIKEKYDYLTNNVLGQEHAVSEFISGYFRSEIVARTAIERNGPRAAFLFAGPPGVGKTKLAEAVADMLDLPFQRYDMSEYCDHEAAIEFIGSDAVFKGSSTGNFTDFVAKNPRCVILLDEIEKAYITIIHLLLQILDKGQIRDSNTDKTLSLHNVILILTTNAGKQLYEEGDARDFSNLPKKVILDALEKDINPRTNEPFFPAAICSRFASGNVVMFNYLEAKTLRKIARNCIIKNIKNFENEFGIKIEIDEDVYTALLFAESGSVDGRTIYGRAESFFHDELFELFRLITSDGSRSTIDDIDKITVSIDLASESTDIRAYFRDDSPRNVLVFSSQQTAETCRSRSENVNILDAQDAAKAKEILRNRDVHYVLIDTRFGVPEGYRYLNIEDIDSVSRDLLHYLREERTDLPIFILQTDESRISDEEKISYLSLGVNDVVTLTDEPGAFNAELHRIAEELHQRDSIVKLASANKLISFETAQTVDPASKTACVRLFDFKTTTAVQAEDSQNILSNVSKPDTTFEEIIGAEDAKDELRYFVEYLKHPKKYMDTGVGTPKGVLLYGPPGTGKTMLAKATAQASDVTFISMVGNQFVQSYSGASKAKVEEVFRVARKYAPAIIFIDEIDTIAKTRTGEPNFAANEEALTAVLAQMDGFKNNNAKPVFVLAATNYDVEATGEKSLDPAMLRRFDRRIYVDLPNREERKRYLKKRIDDNKIFEISDDKIENISIRSTGMSLAELSSVIELALRSAIKDGNLKVTAKIFDEAFETFLSGEKKQWNSELLLRVARHESGHAFLCWHSGEKPSYVTIVARGSHGGYMMHDDNEDKPLYTRKELIGRIRTSLGGRASEIVYYGEEAGVTTGPSSDFANATNIARSMICSYGMSEKLGLAVVGSQMAMYSNLSSEIHAEINRILSEEMQNAIRILRENRAAVDELVDQLMDKNHLSGDEIQAIFEKHAAAN